MGKQPELNGAYYGPSIPPPPRSYNRRGGRGCGCCLIDCLCDCIMSCICTILCTILVIVGLAVLIFWLIVRPHEVKFYASDASLSTFNFTNTNNNNNNLNYNLAVNFTIRNPNKHIGVYYDNIEANAIYAGQRFSTVQAPVFFQGTKNTTDFGPVLFRGQHLVELGSGDRDDYNKQSNDGVYEIQLKLHLRVRFKLGLFKTGTWKPKIKCDLNVPLEGQSSQPFERTRCSYDL